MQVYNTKKKKKKYTYEQTRAINWSQTNDDSLRNTVHGVSPKFPVSIRIVAALLQGHYGPCSSRWKAAINRNEMAVLSTERESSDESGTK